MFPTTMTKKNLRGSSSLSLTELTKDDGALYSIHKRKKRSNSIPEKESDTNINIQKTKKSL